MEKYIKPPVIDVSKKIPYYTPVIPTRIPSEDIPYYYVTQDGDRFDSLAYKFYNNSAKWWILAKANNLGNGSISIPIGTKLFIPNV